MKTNRKILAAVLSVALCMSTVLSPVNSQVWFSNPVNTEIIADAAFDYTNSDNYVADCLQKGIISLEDGVPSSVGNVIYRQGMNHEFTYDKLAQALMDDKTLWNVSRVWNSWQTAISGDFASISQTQIYEALIMDYLTYEVDSASYKSDVIKKMSKYEWKIWKELVKNIKEKEIARSDKIAEEIGQKILSGKAISDKEMEIFDKTCDDLDFVEKVSKYTRFVNLLYTMEQYAKQAVYSASNNYSNSNTQENAVIYVSSFRNYLKYQQYATDWGRKFVSDIVFDGLFNTIKNIFSDKSKATYTEYQNMYDYDILFCKNEDKIIDKWYILYNNYVGMDELPETGTEVTDSSLTYEESEKEIFLNLDKTTTHLFEQNLTLSKNMIINGDLEWQGDINLNGYTLTINGNFTQTDGCMRATDGILNVNGNYTIAENGHICIENSANVNVAKDFIMKSDFTTHYSTSNPSQEFWDGTISIGGNLYQRNGNKNNLQIRGTQIRFVGKGTHNIDSESTNTKINNLTLSNGATIAFIGNLNGVTDISKAVATSSSEAISGESGAKLNASSIGEASISLTSDDNSVSTIEMTVENAPVLGDISMTGEINVVDVIYLQKYISNMTHFNKNQWELADLNGDGKVNVLDLALLKRKLLSK